MKNNPPVALFVFNRADQLDKTLECLRNNQINKLYVFADGPRNKDESRRTDEVRSVINQINWIMPELIFHEKNLGLSESIQFGLNKVFENHDSCIVVEDDVCVAPGFYNFMQTCLTKYYDRKDISGITGLRYPFSRHNLDCTQEDIFLTRRFSSWGWATWHDRWNQVDFNSANVLKTIKNHSDIQWQSAGADLPDSIEAIKRRELSGCWDVYFQISMMVNHKFFVWPKYNLIENTGIGTGSHTSEITPDWNLEWENEGSEMLEMPSQLAKNDIIEEDFLKFFSKPKVKDRDLKKYLKASVNKLGYDIVRYKKPIKHGEIDPTEYTTTDGPIEVPCQKESYFFVLNNYIKDGDKVLDVGMGIGYGMNLLSIKAGEVHAVDVDEKAVKYCTEHVLGKNPKVKKLSHYNGYNLPYKDNEFDVVTCVDVVEHVEDYDKFIDELLRVSKRVVFFATPNRRPEYTNEDGTPTNYWHLREWSYEEFDKIAQNHSKKVEWHFLDGPWEGPFKTIDKSSQDTLVLMPVLIKK